MAESIATQPKSARRTARAILLFGRGSVIDVRTGQRAASEMAKWRVDALAQYLEWCEAEGELTAKDPIRVVATCGWAAGAGEHRPKNRQDREAHLAYRYMEAIGLLGRFGAAVQFGVQDNSYSTTTDGTRGARHELLRDFRPTHERPVGVIAQLGPEGKPNTGHMARCLRATRLGFRLKADDNESVVAIPAFGRESDEAAAAEDRAAHAMSLIMAGSRWKWDIEARDWLAMKLNRVASAAGAMLAGVAQLEQ